MAKFFVSAPVIYPISLVKAASKIDYSIGYNADESRGEAAEKEVYSLLSMLQFDEVYLSPSKILNGSKYLCPLDLGLKVDVVAVLGKKAACYQIKSSLGGVKDYLKKTERVLFNDKAYPVPGVIMIDSNKEAGVGWRLKVLEELSKSTGVSIKEDVQASIDKWKPLRAKLKQIPNTGLLKPNECLVLTQLGLIQVQGKVVKLM